MNALDARASEFKAQVENQALKSLKFDIKEAVSNRKKGLTPVR